MHPRPLLTRAARPRPTRFWATALALLGGCNTFRTQSLPPPDPAIKGITVV